MKKINLEEILNNTCQPFIDDNDNKTYSLWQIKDFSKKLIEQVLELAAEKASINFVENKNYESSTQSDSFSFRDGDGNWCEISIYEASILSIINLIE